MTTTTTASKTTTRAENCCGGKKGRHTKNQQQLLQTKSDREKKNQGEGGKARGNKVRKALRCAHGLEKRAQLAEQRSRNFNNIV